MVGPQRPDDFADNIFDTLKRMGHETYAYGSISPNVGNRVLAFASETALKVSHAEALWQRRLLAWSDKQKLDLILSVQPLGVETVERLRAKRTKVALWFPDAVSNLGRQLMFLAPYTAVFLKEPRLVENARRFLDIPVHYLPEACNSRWHSVPRDVDQGSSPHILMAGNMYAFRLRLLERLVEADIPLVVYGPAWAPWLPSAKLQPMFRNTYLRREEKARAFRAAAGVLNTLHPAEIDGYNARLFEATGCGALTITERRPVLSDLYEEATEVLVYDDHESLVEVCRTALKASQETRRVADAGAVRAHKDHTYEIRLAELLEVVG